MQTFTEFIRECADHGTHFRTIESANDAYAVYVSHESIRPYGPGKFSTILDQYVYSVSLDGGCDEECNVADIWYGLMRHGHTIFRDHDPFLETLNTAEQKQLTESAGTILHEDSNGFVYVQYFDSVDVMEKAWNEVLENENDCR